MWTPVRLFPQSNPAIKKGIRRLVGHFSYRCTLVWQALYCVFSVDDIHQRNTGDLSYASSEFTITSCNDITFMWCDSLDKTVIGIGTSMGTSESFESRIACYTIVSNQLNTSPFMIPIEELTGVQGGILNLISQAQREHNQWHTGYLRYKWAKMNHSQSREWILLHLA